MATAIVTIADLPTSIPDAMLGEKSMSSMALITTPAMTLNELYNTLFETIVADTDELIDECYKLRYQVYCVENPFEEPDPEIGEYERDIYDGYSIHALLRHRQSGEFVGTVRLIVDSKDSPQRMPILRIGEDNHIALPQCILQEPCAEISRFCIAKTFRRRITDTMFTGVHSDSDMATLRSRIVPFMATGLMAAVFRLCYEHGIAQTCAVMEPSLVRMLTKLGIRFQTIGSPVEYHGVRNLCHITSAGLYESLLAERPDILQLMTDDGRFPLRN